MNSSVHIDHKEILVILGEEPTWRLDGTTLAAEEKYLINFTKNDKKFCLRLHELYNLAKSYLFADGTEIIEFKAKDSEVVATRL